MIVTTFEYKELIFAAITLLTIIQSSYSSNMILMSTNNYNLRSSEKYVVENSHSVGYNDLFQVKYIIYIMQALHPQYSLVIENVNYEKFKAFMEKFNIFFDDDDYSRIFANIRKVMHYTQVMDGYNNLNNVKNIFKAPVFDWSLLPINDTINFKTYIDNIYLRLCRAIHIIKKYKLKNTDIINDIDGYVNKLYGRLNNIFIHAHENPSWFKENFLESDPMFEEPFTSYVLRNMARDLIPAGPMYFNQIYDILNRIEDFDYYRLDVLSDAALIMALIINYDFL